MSELPTPVSESTAIEVVRQEGSARSWPANDTLAAGDIVYTTPSGLAKAIISTQAWMCPGAVLYTAVSGSRAVTIKGKVRARWDGSGTLNRGVVIQQGAHSGWFTVAVANIFASGTHLGLSWDNGGATTSGKLHVVELL